MKWKALAVKNRKTGKELTDELKSVSSLFMNHEKCCQIFTTEALNLSKHSYIRIFQVSEMIRTRFL